jgi:hypothetical protein
MAAEQPISTTQLYVSNLPAGTTNDRLKAAFDQFGDINDCFVPQRKRFGFVKFTAEADATKAVSAMNGKALDEAAAGEEVIEVVPAREKPEKEESEKKKPAKKKPKNKEAKEPKKQAEQKKVPAGAGAEKTNRRKRANKKAPAAKKSVPTFEEREASYKSDLGAKCLLFGYAHWEAMNAEVNFDKDEAGKPNSGFPGLNWMKQALSQQGIQKSLFLKDHTATWCLEGDSWRVTVDVKEDDNFILACTGKEAPAEHGLAAGAASLRRDLMNEARFSMTMDKEQDAINRATLWLLERAEGKASAKQDEPAAEKAAAPAAPAEEEESVRGSSTHVDLNNLKDSGTGELSAEEFAALRAKTKSAADVAKNLTPEQQAEYGCKPGVAASAVRPDSDDSDDEGADFAMGGEGQAVLLADY